jgi:dihydrofolate reductase
MIKAIAAMTHQRVIGLKNDIPWHLPEDLKRLNELTFGHYLLMGRKTYESLPVRPLKNRFSLVVSRQCSDIVEECEGVAFFSSLNLAREYFENKAKANQDLWIFGGAQVYEATISWWNEMYLTIVKKDYQGDTFLPPFEHLFAEESCEDFTDFSYVKYSRSLGIV